MKRTQTKDVMDKNYELSNKFETYPKAKVKSSSKKCFNVFVEFETISQVELQLLADNICNDFGVKKIPIIFDGVQSNSTRDGKLVSKTLGTFYSLNKMGMYIKIAKFTAIKKKHVATKTAIHTLIHELCHYFDYELLKVEKSIHSSGFYKRISSIENMLKA